MERSDAKGDRVRGDGKGREMVRRERCTLARNVKTRTD